MYYGHAQVSTTTHSLDIQHEQLKEYGWEATRSENKTGISTQEREALNILLEFIRDGDFLVVTRLDRLARSMCDLQKIVKTLRDRGANLVITQ